MKLDRSQRKFCESKARHLRVLAPVGGGKTSALLYRCLHLSEQEHGERFLLVTLTKAAEQEAGSRLAEDPDLAPIRDLVTVSTLNAYGYRRLRNEIQHPKLLSQGRDRHFAMRNQLHPVWSNHEKIASAITGRGNHGRRLMAVIDELKALGFDHTTDTNPLDRVLIKTIAESHRATVTIVDDDDQAIFEWRGATLEYILHLDDHFENKFQTVTTPLSGWAALNTHKVPHPVERTTAGPPGQIRFAPAESTAEAVLEIRRRSGLTWEEMSDLLDVSRRSIHHWASGKSVSARRERALRRALAAIRRLDRGDQAGTRARLLAVDHSTGLSVLDMMREGRFDEITARTEEARPPAPLRVPLSREAQKARRPPSPPFLLEAKQDRPDIPARARAVRAVRPPAKTD